jgi:hypothetical protein
MAPPDAAIRPSNIAGHPQVYKGKPLNPFVQSLPSACFAGKSVCRLADAAAGQNESV